jgi:hypothetical protein
MTPTTQRPSDCTSKLETYDTTRWSSDEQLPSYPSPVLYGRIPPCAFHLPPAPQFPPERARYTCILTTMAPTYELLPVSTNELDEPPGTSFYPA